MNPVRSLARAKSASPQEDLGGATSYGMNKILTVVFVGLISFVGLVVVAFNFEPIQSADYIKFLFYSLLFALLWSLGTVVFYYFSKKDELQFEMAFKRGFLISSALLFILILLRLIK